MTKEVQKLFDDIAPNYDFINGLLSLRIDQRWRRQAVASLPSTTSIRVLDLCAGTLALTSLLLRRNPRAHVTAVDFSEEMLETGRKKIPYGYLSRLRVEKMDVMTLPFPAHTFDAAMCAYGMRNLEDNERALTGIRRVLKPGGKLVILDFFAPDRWRSRLFYATYGNLIVPTLGRLISQNPRAYHYLKNSIRGFYTPPAYVEILKSIGFKNTTLKRQTAGISCLITAEA